MRAFQQAGVNLPHSAAAQSGFGKSISFGSLKPGDFLVVMGTVSPVAIKELGKKLSTFGVHLVDAPVSGGDVGAKNGTLSIMVGGSVDEFNTLKPIFEKIGSTVKHLGPLGAGEMAKACNQIVVAVTLSALAEAVTLGRKAGLDTKTLLDILAGGLANSQVLNVKREKIESGDFTPGGSADFQLKDIRFALEAGASTGTYLPTTETVKNEQVHEIGRRVKNFFSRRYKIPHSCIR